MIMNKEDKYFIQKYEELLDKGYCDCNEMNCIDNNSPRRILNIVKNQDKEIEKLTAESTEWESKCYKYQDIINELENYLEEEQTRLARECSNIYEDSLGKTKLVSEDIFNEITRIKDKLKELKEGK